MPGWLRRSFSRRLAVAFTVVGLVAATVTAIAVNLAFEAGFAGYLDEQQAQREDRIVAAVADGYARAEGWDAETIATALRGALTQGAEVAVRDAGGALVWSSDDDRRGGGHGSGRGGHGRMHDDLALAEPVDREIVVDGEAVGTATIAQPEAGGLPTDQAFRSQVNAMVALGALVAGLLALGLGVLMARRVTAPARRLTAAAQALPADRSARVPERGDDELADMARAFNRMAATVAAQEALRRDFAADVAHELRTPLAVLRGRLEALSDGITEPTPEHLADLHDEVLTLTQRVADLEALSRADAAEFTLDRRPVDVAATAAEAAAAFADRLGDRLVVGEPRGDPTVEADPDRLGQIVTNLLANAERHAPGATVRVDVTGTASTVELVVADDGPGIAADQQPRVFDRFARGPDGGSGVGLTIVADLAAAHGGHVSLDSAPGQGTTVTVSLPRSAPAPPG